LTDRGRELEQALSSIQMRRIARAYREAGAEAVAGFRRVMVGIINPEDRTRFDEAPARPPRAAARR
jgi:hypothetical protein